MFVHRDILRSETRRKPLKNAENWNRFQFNKTKGLRGYETGRFGVQNEGGISQ